MNLESIYHLSDGAPSTFAQDEELPALPLPTLADSIERYYEAIQPFGNKEELANTRRLLEDFKNGIGKKLHQMLKEKAKSEKNWVSLIIALNTPLSSLFYNY